MGFSFSRKGERCMIFILGFIIGVVAGSYLLLLFKIRYLNGHLKIIDLGEKDNFTLFIDDFDKIYKHKYLLLKIDNTRK